MCNKVLMCLKNEVIFVNNFYETTHFVTNIMVEYVKIKKIIKYTK